MHIHVLFFLHRACFFVEVQADVCQGHFVDGAQQKTVGGTAVFQLVLVLDLPFTGSKNQEVSIEVGSVSGEFIYEFFDQVRVLQTGLIQVVQFLLTVRTGFKAVLCQLTTEFAGKGLLSIAR